VAEMMIYVGQYFTIKCCFIRTQFMLIII